MQLSTKGRYAVMAMTDLAGQGESRPVTLAEIAERQQLSTAYLEQLFARLRRRGLVQSVRGPGGGYRLAKSAAETTIADVVTAVDEPLRATRCTGHDSALGCMKGGVKCATHNLWESTGQLIQDYFASISLADVAAGRLPSQPARAA